MIKSIEIIGYDQTTSTKAGYSIAVRVWDDRILVPRDKTYVLSDSEVSLVQQDPQNIHTIFKTVAQSIETELDAELNIPPVQPMPEKDKNEAQSKLEVNLGLKPAPKYKLKDRVQNTKDIEDKLGTVPANTPGEIVEDFKAPSYLVKFDNGMTIYCQEDILIPI